MNPDPQDGSSRPSSRRRNAARPKNGLFALPLPSPQPRPHTGADLPDPDLATLTLEDLQLVAALTALSAGLNPSVAARERMRARVLLTAQTGEAQPPTTAIDEFARRRRLTGSRGRFLVAAAAALGLVIALSGISLALSRDALPGDALYTVKRAGEATSLALTQGEANRGLRELGYATNRVDELSALVDQRHDGALVAHGNPGIITVAYETVDSSTVAMLLTDFDAAAAAGSRLLTAAGVAGDPAAFGSLSSWAQDESSRLLTLRSSLPADGQARVDHAQSGLTQVRDRVDVLTVRLECLPITTGKTDDLGPLPAVGCTRSLSAASDSTTANTGTPATPPTRSANTNGANTNPAGPGARPTTGPTGTPPSAGSTSAGRSTGQLSAPAPTPTLPASAAPLTPTLPSSALPVGPPLPGLPSLPLAPAVPSLSLPPVAPVFPWLPATLNVG